MKLYNTIILITSPAWAVNLPLNFQHSVLCSHPTTAAYDALVANHSSMFHAHYSEGRPDLNGPLASPSIDWAYSVNVIGRQNFVAGLSSFRSTAPDTALSDRLRIHDGNVVAIFYSVSGHATGPFEGNPANNATFQVNRGEVHVYDDNALLYRLITVAQTDDLLMQLTGQINLTTIQKYPLVDVSATTSPEYVCQIKANVQAIATSFNSNQTTTVAQLLASNVTYSSNNVTNVTGSAAFIAHLKSLKGSFPDLLQHDEYIIGQGSYTAVESFLEGHFTGAPFLASNGTLVSPDGKMKRVRVMRFFEHDKNGLISNMWEVYNNNDFLELNA